MELPWEIAAGTVAGRDHVDAGKNNQDAYLTRVQDDLVVAVVCDGCFGGKHSEVGAQLGAQIILRMVHECARFLRHLDQRWSVESAAQAMWDQTEKNALNQLRILAGSVSSMSFSRAVSDYLLFTTVGALITPEETMVFSNGDGMYVLNGTPTRIGPFPGNEPPYLAYALLEPDRVTVPRASIRFNYQVFPTVDVHSMLIGTDGVLNLEAAAERNIPGSSKLVGPLGQFWTEDRYFANPDAVRRMLTLINRTSVRPDWQTRSIDRQPGLLPDDTTLVAIRRKNGVGV